MIEIKYVAFLDIMGFKNELKKRGQAKAKEYIESFSTIAYKVWNENNTEGLTGNIVSDSFIIYTRSTDPKQLRRLIEIIIKICREEFSKNSILIRGGLAKGEFDTIPAKELDNLSKNLIVGQAYIDAYLLESVSKNFGITFEETVFSDLQNCNYDHSSIKYYKKTDKYLLQYIDIDFLIDNNNLKRFIILAKESNWLPYYYNAIENAIKNGNNNKKVNQLFYDIISIISDYNPQSNYMAINIFIENAFKDDVDYNFKSRFLRFIRKKLI